LETKRKRLIILSKMNQLLGDASKIYQDWGKEKFKSGLVLGSSIVIICAGFSFLFSLSLGVAYIDLSGHQVNEAACTCDCWDGLFKVWIAFDIFSFLENMTEVDTNMCIGI